MEELVRLVVEALPWVHVSGDPSIAQLVVSALPFLEGLVDTAQVVVTALPAFGAAVVSVVVSPWGLGLMGGGFLTWAWKELV